MRIQHIPLFVLGLIGLICSSTFACPTEITEFCNCQELDNGVILDCRNGDPYKAVAKLREKQTALGLIQSLTLSYESELKNIPPMFFDGLFIKKLDLSNNVISKIDDKAFDGMNAVLQEIILSKNLLTKVPVKALSSLPLLLRLDVSNNTIGDITENDVFPMLSKIYDINLGGNNISSIHTNAFQHIKNTIQVINLGHNQLSAVPSSAIRGLKQLQSLHLHRNKIRQLEPLNFLNLPVLNLLNLAGNRITELNRQAFLNVPNLRYLYLTNNLITQLAAHQFATFEMLEMLDLTGNLIEQIPSNCLSELKALRQLYLGENKINKIGENAFVNSSIVILILSNNDLTELPEGVITGLPNLQQVSFKKNKLKSIHQNAFYNVPSLVMIDLGYNELTDIAPSTFLAQLNMLLIDLTHNKLAKTPYAAFNRRVGSVLLSENPLVCTEKIHMLQDGTGINVHDSEDLICGGKPKTTTTTTPAPLHQMPKLLLKKQQDAPQAAPADDEEAAPQIPSGAFQKAGLVKDAAPVPIVPVAPINDRKSHSRFILNKDSGVPRIPLPARPTETSREHEPAAPDQGEVLEEELPGQLSDFVLDEPNQQAAINQGSVDTTPAMLARPPVLPSRNDPEPPTPIVTSTSTVGPRRYTDIADNPNIVHPFPVPFLKRGPNMNKATAVKAPATEDQLPQELHTLPPSILIEPGSTPKFNTSQVSEHTSVNAEKFEEFALRSQANKDEDTDSVTPPGQNKSMFPTTIVIICVGTALVVMIAVILGLCISKHRQLRFENTYSDTSAARTNEYVAAQAHMNSVYSTHNGRPVGRFDDSPAWIYNPGANYCNYYK